MGQGFLSSKEVIILRRYIYNLDQAYFYIQNGVIPISVPKINPSTGKVYFTFGDVETREVYSRWCTRKITG